MFNQSWLKEKIVDSSDCLTELRKLIGIILVEPVQTFEFNLKKHSTVLLVKVSIYRRTVSRIQIYDVFSRNLRLITDTSFLPSWFSLEIEQALPQMEQWFSQEKFFIKDLNVLTLATPDGYEISYNTFNNKWGFKFYSKGMSAPTLKEAIQKDFIQSQLTGLAS